MRIRYVIAVACTFGLLLWGLTTNANTDDRRGPTVRVTVQATDSSGQALHYCWRSTDGVIQDNDSNTTSWTLPAGRGIHFAYVLVSNGLGGFTDRRIGINTDRFRGDRDDDDDAGQGQANVALPPCPVNQVSGNGTTCDEFFDFVGVCQGVMVPTISGTTASLHGRLLPSPIAQFEPPPTGLPSDIEPQTDVFLSANGVDTRISACQYYQAIGAVKSCGPNGELNQPITYRDWRKAVKIGRFATAGTPTYRAAFVNKVDLNITRVHQSISYGPGQTAAVVCNHLGTNKFFNPTQDDIDDAVLNAVNNKNLVACVAMDYMINPGVNGNNPFVRFLIFGPSGELLPSVNLDGRAEKFVPGTCVVCHGGNTYVGSANVNGNFLPYDTANFEFANAPGLRKCDQQESIYHLNQNVLNTSGPNAGHTAAETNLIGGWYATLGNGPCSPNVTHVLNENFVPGGGAVNTWSQNPIVADVYTNFVARSCRTCHTALSGFNWDDYQTFVGFLPTAVGLMCGNIPDNVLTMPNSLVTFNRFWLTHNNTAGFRDQVQLLQNFLLQNSQPALSPNTCPALAEVIANPNP